MNPFLFKLVVLVTCFMLVMLYNKSKGAGTISFKKHDSKYHHTIAKK